MHLQDLLSLRKENVVLRQDIAAMRETTAREIADIRVCCTVEIGSQLGLHAVFGVTSDIITCLQLAVARHCVIFRYALSHPRQYYKAIPQSTVYCSQLISDPLTDGH